MTPMVLGAILVCHKLAKYDTLKNFSKSENILKNEQSQIFSDFFMHGVMFDTLLNSKLGSK
jgi:hypothetical protein